MPYQFNIFIGIVSLVLLGFTPETVYAESNTHQTKKPNVLFIICDDLNCNLGCYGHPLVKSPNIDALAKQGIQFNKAYCQLSLCGPSRASFMTSLYPDQSLIKRNAIYIRKHLPNVTTMSQAFRNVGYHATRVGKIYHYNVPKHIGTSGHDDPYSWNDTFNPRGRDVEDEDKIHSLVPGNFGGTLSWLSADGTDEEQTDGIAALQTCELLEKRKQDGKPFFLAVGLYRPHTPYVAPHNYFNMYPRNTIKLPSEPKGYLQTLPEFAQKTIRAKKQQINLDPEIARKVIQAYYASITFADAQVGIILKKLKETGLDDNTYIVFTSDHGYHMGEHGHWQKQTLFEDGTRVPLIIAGPDLKSRGQQSEALVEMIDFYPTLTALCNVPAPKHVMGKSLVPVLNSPSTQVREASLSQSFIGKRLGYSIRTSRYRYTVWGDMQEKGKELYDHNTDPEELKNLADDPAYAELLDKLHAIWEAKVKLANSTPAGIRQVP